MSEQSGLLGYSDAQFSSCKQYRYSLYRQWAEARENIPLVWIGLNPSKAETYKNDNTVTRCIRFSMYMGAVSMVMLNLFAFRATSPAWMKSQEDPIGPDNDCNIKYWIGDRTKVIVCWGSDGSFMNRDKEVMDLILPRCGKIYCLGTTLDGFPRHPSRLAYDTELVEYERR